jgi:hypothetical protein
MRLLVSDGSEADMRKIMQRVAPAMKAGCIGPPELCAARVILPFWMVFHGHSLPPVELGHSRIQIRTFPSELEHYPKSWCAEFRVNFFDQNRPEHGQALPMVRATALSSARRLNSRFFL